MHKLSIQCFTITGLLLFGLGAVYGQVTMPGAPKGAYTNYFKYYRPGAADMPAGVDHTANAVIGLYQPDYQVHDQVRSGSGTGFLIYTRRDDHKICVCTAGHFIERYFGAYSGDIISFDVYMKYWGRPSAQNPHLNAPVSGFKTTLHASVILRMIRNPANGRADAALLLVDEEELPVAAPYMLGYSEEDVYNTASSFYTISHPKGMAQKVADNLVFASSSPVYTPPSGQFMFSATANNATAPGSSGSPVLYKGQGNFVTGIYDGKADSADTFIPPAELIPGDPPIQYSRNYLYATKMAALLPAIRKHCWQQDSAGIASSQSYKQGTFIDNSALVAKFLANRSITSQANIPIEKPVYDICPGCILLKANLLTINCPLTPGTALPWLFGLAKEVRLDAGFSYTASGNYYMDMNTVVPEQVASARNSNTDSTKPQGSMDTVAAGFRVYPNPSSSGVFYLSVPKNDHDYSLKVFSADGRLVYEAATLAGQAPYRFSLSGRAQGIYVLSLYKKQTGERVFSKTIIYQ